MSTNPIDKNSTPKPTGSLEELFRHHLGEEAAVPPRPMLWDQIDNSLLIKQNETYRKRLVATRWVAAASLFLATLAGTGWWSTHDSHLGEGTVATTSRSAASGTNASTAENAATGNTGSGTSTNDALNQSAASASQAASVAAASGSGTATGAANGQGIAPRNLATDGSADAATQAGSSAAAQRAAIATLGNAAGRHTGFGAMPTHNGLNNASAATGYSARYNSGTRATEAASARPTAANVPVATTGPDAIANQTKSADDKAALGNTGMAGLAPSVSGQALAATSGAATAAPAAAAAGVAAGLEGASTVTALAQTTTAAMPEQVSLLAARTAALNMATADALPNGLTALALPEPEPAAISHRWHYGATYTAGLFNPNINFSRKGIEPEHDYNPALGPDSPALTEAAGTQYRQNLRPGFSQRIALLATRHLTGHWSLSTGAEFMQATAKSATATSFVGEQLPDLGLTSTGPLHTTDFRYSLASIPVEVRYSNPVKRGWSLYGRLGGVVSALLGVRSEVEDNPEATRTYSILSAGTPYRRAVVSLRGAAGTQFRNNTGKWAFTLGPVAEIGLTSMNAHPVQSYLAQSHAYSFGLEAGVEFGK